MGNNKDIKRLVRQACKPVVMPPEFKVRLLKYLLKQAISES
ncbi:hypothetical protein ES703_113581 [subsurface metagenome]